MPEAEDLAAIYLEHLRARLRLSQAKAKRRSGDEDLAILPSSVARFCSRKPLECLELIEQTLQKADSPELVRAIGDGLLEDLLNEKSDALADRVERLLRTSKRFRQAFACGEYSSVDPAIIAGWVAVFQDLGTTKTAERKSLWRSAV